MIDEKLKEYLVDSVKDEPKILAIGEGVDPEEGTPTLYFLIGNNEYDKEFSTSITKLELEIIKKFPEQDYQFMEWPTNPKKINASFIGEIIYKK